MDPNEVKAMMLQIPDVKDDQGALTSLLAKIETAFTDLFATHASVTEENKKLTEENTQLKSYNWELFQQRGQQITNNNQTKSDPKADKARERAETITIDDLFKEEK